MSHGMRNFSKAAVGLVIGMLLCAGAMAQTFPNRPITLLVPFPAGGLSDVVSRLFGPPLSKQLGQPVVVENLAGATGSIAAQKMLNAPADGHVIFMGGVNELILAPLTISAIKFKSEDFRLVQTATVANMVVIARKDLPAQTADELVEFARNAAKSGKPLTYASVGVGSFYHLMGESLSQITGIPMTHVPYKGGAPANQDLMAGVVDIFITPYGKMYDDLHKQGKLKIIASLSAERPIQLKDYPAVGESKSLKNFTSTIWGGFFVRQGTPEPVMQALHTAFGAALGDTAVRAGLEAQGMTIPLAQSATEADRYYVDSVAQLRQVTKSIQLQPQ
jgi:tripartite-type tricarboxylate transporter receptor subunit TctC